jgi:hypothetical protein
MLCSSSLAVSMSKSKLTTFQIVATQKNKSALAIKSFSIDHRYAWVDSHLFACSILYEVSILLSFIHQTHVRFLWYLLKYPQQTNGRGNRTPYFYSLTHLNLTTHILLCSILDVLRNKEV